MDLMTTNTLYFFHNNEHVQNKLYNVQTNTDVQYIP